MNHAFSKKILIIIFFLFGHIFFFTRSASAQNIGINTETPTEKLDVNGKIRIRDGAQNGYILQSDADGVGTWTQQIHAQRKQVCVTDLGAIGDGTTDDTAAFQNAIDSVAMLGGILCVPVGNYKITSTLSVPAGVILQGVGLGNSYINAMSSTSGSRISYSGSGTFAIEIKGDFAGLRDLFIVDTGGSASGGIHFNATGATLNHSPMFSNLYVYNFVAGSGLKLEATSTSGIAYMSIYNLNVRNAKKGIHVSVQNDGSFVNLVSFFGGSITGTGYDYDLHVEGNLTGTYYYGTAFNSDCPTVGHIVVEEQGRVLGYGIAIESADAGCSMETVLVHFKSSSTGNYIHGNAGKGQIIDEAGSYIDLSGDTDTGLRPSGYNLFPNSAFNGISNNDIPFWECSGCTVEAMPPEFKDGHNVLKITVPANTSLTLKPESTFFSNAFNHKECLYGAMIKTSVADFVQPAYFRTGANCTITTLAASHHPGDGNWYFTGGIGSLDPNNSCEPDPRFIFNNSANGTASEVYVSTPSFVFQRGTMPHLEAGPITGAGGIMTGTLSTALVNIASPSDNTLEFEHNANVYQISGTNSIESINLSADIFPQGTQVILLFESASLTVEHNVSKITLLGAANYISETYSSLTLVSLGDGSWIEVSRNCVSGC